MTSVLSCFVATIALAADPGPLGLPFGVPPAPDDLVIAHVAPPQCLFYVDWAGTAAPSPDSNSETEKLLAEPEVQTFFRGLNKVITAYLQKQHEDATRAVTTVVPIPSTQYSVPSTQSPVAKPQPGAAAIPAPAAGARPSAPPSAPYAPTESRALVPPAPTAAPAPIGAAAIPAPAAGAAPIPSTQNSVLSTDSPAPKPLPPAPPSPSLIPPPSGGPLRELPINISPAPEKPKFEIPAEDYADWLSVLLTHPTAIFIEDVKVTPAKPAEKKADKKIFPDPKKASDQQSEEKTDVVNVRAGMVVSLGPDSTRLFLKFVEYFAKAKKAGADSGFEQVQIHGETWYRYTPPKPGDKNPVTFGFHGKYFVVGVGSGAVEGILARWNSPTPAWLARALEQTLVPRRTGIIYLNLKAIRDKLLPLAPSQKDALAVLDLLGLYNLDSLVSTTGLEADGMINRLLLATDGKPRGLLDIVADRPLAAKDLEAIPQDAMLAVAARVDLERTFHVLVSAYKIAGAVGDADVQKAVDKFKQENGIDVPRLLSSLGDTWCAYNSPAEGEIIFLGWTAVVSVRDRAALVDCWEKFCAVQEKMKAKKKDAKDAKDKNQDNVCELFDPSLEFRKCRFAGQEIYYVAGQLFAPVFCITDHEMVMTLSMPAMKAYLLRKNHRSLAAVPSVAPALNGPNRPAALLYCDTPRVFELLYPLVSLYAALGEYGRSR